MSEWQKEGSPSLLQRVVPAVAWLSAMLAAAASLAYVARQQFSILRHQVLQGDELFFSACASRGLVDGWASVAGCHDTKAPLIYIIHGLLLRISHPYDPVALKVASGVMLALIAGLSACVARRASPVRPNLAAVATVVLLLAALAPNPSLLAVKTEMLGILFVLLALVIAPVAGAPTRIWHALGMVLALGMAVMSKQTYAFIVPMGFWLIWNGCKGGSFKSRVQQLAVFSFGLALPGLLFTGLFAITGKLDEFLASNFLYPLFYEGMGYAGADAPSRLKRLVWTVTLISEFLQQTPMHFALAVAVLLGLGTRIGLLPLQRALLLACGLSLAVLLVSPHLFDYHTIPFWVLASVLSGPVLASTHAAGGWNRNLAAAVLLVAATLGLGTTLRNNSGQERAYVETAPLQTSAGKYAYVLGLKLEFYAAGFIPASSVQIPWALPGTPGSWSFRPPAPGTRLEKVLTAQQERNLKKLYQDFESTPPAYIIVMDSYARAANSPRISDVPGFDEYLAKHCEPRGTVMMDAKANREPVRLFVCGTAKL